MTEAQLNALSKRIIGAAIDVHRKLGPGLDELDYEQALSLSLTKAGIANERQVPLPIIYKAQQLDCGYRLDILVESALVLELKSVAAVLPIHEAQLLTYLRLSGHQLGLLANFNVVLLKDGILRRVNQLGREPLERNCVVRNNSKPSNDLSRRAISAAIEVHAKDQRRIATAWHCATEILRTQRTMKNKTSTHFSNPFARFSSLRCKQPR